MLQDCGKVAQWGCAHSTGWVCCMPVELQEAQALSTQHACAGLKPMFGGELPGVPMSHLTESFSTVF